MVALAVAVFLVSAFLHLGSAEIYWTQESFDDGKNLKDNFGKIVSGLPDYHICISASWKVYKYAWGFDEELAEVIDQTLQVKIFNKQ